MISGNIEIGIDVGTDADAGKPVHYVYLAGPEVFLPEPIAAGAEKKARIAALSRAADWPFELAGLYPLDNEIPDFRPDFDTGMRIYRANVELMDRAHAVAANMVRFRGPSMDVGTAFEMGYMRGLGKPVFAYYDAAPFYGREEVPGMYVDRVRAYCSVSEHAPRVDADRLSVDDFGMADNLMMIGALESGAGSIAESFDQAVAQIAEFLLKPDLAAQPRGREERPGGSSGPADRVRARRVRARRGVSPRRAG